MFQAAECGWDSELASSEWDPVSGLGEVSPEAEVRLQRLVDTGSEYSIRLHGPDSEVTHNWRRRRELIEKNKLK